MAGPPIFPSFRMALASHGICERCRRRAGRIGGRFCNDLGWQPKGSNRVNRGGSWNNNAINCRAANRNNNNPTNRNDNLGFRSVLPPAQPGCRRAAGLTRRPSCPRTQLCRGKDAGKSRPVPVGWRSQSKTPGGPAERCRPSSRRNSPCGKPATSDACPSGDASGLGPP